MFRFVLTFLVSFLFSTTLFALKVTDYLAASTLSGSEVTYVNQSGADRKATVAQIARASGGAVSVAAASTIDLGALAGDVITITGTAAISSFGSTAPAASKRWLYFTGTPTIVYNATSMKLPGATNLSITANTWLYVVALGSGNWSVVANSLFQFPNDAVPSLGASLGDVIVALSSYVSTNASGPCVNVTLSSSTFTFSGNCVLGEQGYLAKVGAGLLFCPHKGNSIMIAGTIYTIPNSCASLAVTGLTAGTYYYIYAYPNSGVLSTTLEASTTGHFTNTTYGYEQKNGDSSRALVGAVYVTTGPAFADSTTQRYVVSWFNPQPKRCVNTFSTNRTQTGSTGAYAEINSEIQCSFIILGPPSLSNAAARPVIWRANGAVGNGASSSGCSTSAGFDSTSNAETEIGAFTNIASLPGAADIKPLGISGMVTTLTEGGGSSGLHYVTLLGREITGGTCTWYSAYTSLEVDVWQ